jgi:hypothetical protein
MSDDNSGPVSRKKQLCGEERAMPARLRSRSTLREVASSPGLGHQELRPILP